MSICALCKSDRSLKQSHTLPRLVFERIKRNGPTGYLRGGFLDVNLRRQDGDTHRLLCGECEERFSQAEKTFAEQIFEPYHDTGATPFAYGPWLSYFISSVNWRGLHLDNGGFHSDKKWPSEILAVLDNAEAVLGDFL